MAGTVLQEYGTTLVSVQEPVNGGAGLRCDTLTFVVPPDADLSNATIVIDSIAATPREDEYCSVYMPKIQQAMLERGIGITLDCVDVNGQLDDADHEQASGDDPGTSRSDCLQP